MRMNLAEEGMDETRAALRRLPKDAKKRLKNASKSITEKLKPKARSAATSDFSPQSSLVAPTVTTLSGGDQPTVKVGGTKRVGRNRVPVYKVLFGSEFGSNRYDQFGRPHSGQKGNWFFPVVEENQKLITDEWRQAADDVVDDFTRGGL